MTFEIHTAKCKILHFKSCFKCLVQKEKHNEQKILLFHFCCHFRAFTSTAAGDCCNVALRPWGGTIDSQCSRGSTD